MDATAAPTTGSLLPRVVSAQSTLPLPLAPVAIAVKAVPYLLLVSRQRRVDPYLLAPPRMRCLINRSLMQNRHITLCNSNLGEPASQVQLTNSLFKFHSPSPEPSPISHCLFVVRGANAPFVAGLHWAVFKVLRHFAPLAASSPPSLGGEGFPPPQKKKDKKKKTPWRVGYLRPTTSFS